MKSILYDVILFYLTPKRYELALMEIINGTMSSEWLLKNCQGFTHIDIDLKNFSTEQAKSELRELVLGD